MVRFPYELLTTLENKGFSETSNQKVIKKVIRPYVRSFVRKESIFWLRK